MIKKDLLIHHENGTYSITKPVYLEEMCKITEELLASKFNYLDLIENPSESKRYLINKLATLEREVFGCLFLTNGHDVIAYEELFQGTINGASVYPREVVKRALQFNAAAVVFVHNHPSGKPEPSTADESITQTLIQSLTLVDIRVLDHIIVGGSEAVSFAERGLI
jgi:DNA repair protein RadC